MEGPSRQRIRSIIRLSFLMCMIVVFFLALSPRLPGTGHFGSDKAQHFLAFLALSGLGRLGWPSSTRGISFGLLVLGGTIELLQGSPFIGRDMSLSDWFADAIGIVGGVISISIAMRFAPLRNPP